MGHGAPDNYEVQQKATTYRLDDMAELAVRQGAIPSIDRLGEVFYRDDFSNGLGIWSPSTSPPESTVTINTNYFMTSGFSVKLDGDGDEDDYAAIDIVLPYPYLSRWGFEFWGDFASDIKELIFKLGIATGSDEYYFYIALDVANHKIWIREGLIDYTELESSWVFNPESRLFMAFKLVADFITKKYVRFRTYSKTYDISAYNVYHTSLAAYPSVWAGLWAYSNSGLNDHVFIDNILLTQNEP